MKKVADIMTPEVVTIRNSASVAEAINLMHRRSVHALIVQPSDAYDAYGVVAASDVVGQVVAFGHDPKQVRVYEIMTKPCIVLNPNLRIEYAARLLTQHNLHSAPVIQSELLGILSISDILAHSTDKEMPRSRELANNIQSLTAAARQICASHGAGSTACANAWVAVDTLQAELARQKSESIPQTASEQYWQDYQETFKGRDYDEWCSG